MYFNIFFTDLPNPTETTTTQAPTTTTTIMTTTTVTMEIPNSTSINTTRKSIK